MLWEVIEEDEYEQLWWVGQVKELSSFITTTKCSCVDSRIGLIVVIWEPR